MAVARSAHPYVYLWECEVRPDAEEEFRRTYGRDGDSAESYAAFKRQFAGDFAELDRRCEGFTVRETPLGEFHVR